LLIASVEVAETTPAVAKRVPLKEPIAKVEVVALVTLRLREFNQPVVVALVAVTLASCERPETASAVVVALVAVRLSVSSKPVVVAFTAVRFPEMSALPWTEKRAPGVLVATPTLLLASIVSALTVEVANEVGEEVARPKNPP
jgi:hypothetical protein